MYRLKSLFSSPVLPGKQWTSSMLHLCRSATALRDSMGCEALPLFVRKLGGRKYTQSASLPMQTLHFAHTSDFAKRLLGFAQQPDGVKVVATYYCMVDVTRSKRSGKKGVEKDGMNHESEGRRGTIILFHMHQMKSNMTTDECLKTVTRCRLQVS